MVNRPLHDFLQALLELASQNVIVLGNYGLVDLP